ncbi:MAG: glycosyltransferase family 2 protein [Dethiobacteria bacterium]|jgi:glycosyltransferase involved in cell wall biosynthesis
MLVSIVMAVYNGQEYLQDAVDSILRQTYTSFELIIINDASTDRTKEILGLIADKRVKVIHLKENRGAAFALNLGISQAKGKWIAVHDADDLSYPYRIEKQIDYLKQRRNLVAAGSFIECIPGRNDYIPQQNLGGLENLINRVQTSEEIKLELFRTCPLTHGTMIYSKKAFTSLGKYNPVLKISYDYDLWTRLITAGNIEKVPEKLYKYRMHSNSLTTKNQLQNINEMFFSCAKYIRINCYKEHKERPVMLVFGPTYYAQSFSLQTRNNLNVVKIIDQNEINLLPMIINLFKNKKLDGAVILSNFKYRDSVFNYLEKHGLKLNVNFFEFWIWL